MDEPVDDVLMDEVERVGDGAEPEEWPAHEPLEASGGGHPDGADAAQYDEVAEVSAVWPREQEFADDGGGQEEPVAAAARVTVDPVEGDAGREQVEVGVE